MTDANINTIPGKVEVKADQVIGSAKQSVGNAVEKNGLKDEGFQQSAAGNGKETVKNIADFFQKVTNEAEGTFKGTFWK